MQRGGYTRRTLRVFACVALAALVPAGSASAATERLVFSPFGADGQVRSDLTVVARSEGGNPAYPGCDTSRQAPGAYRCFTGNVIRDPCYADPTVDSNQYYPVVVCAQSPWADSAVRIALREELPAPDLSRPSWPWALELTGGKRCIFINGATAVRHGYRLNYACGSSLFLFGTPRAGSDTWKIRQSRSATGRGMRMVAIARAWR